MVFLALTPSGLAEALQLAVGTQPVWCSADAITEREFAQGLHKNLTRFAFSLPVDRAAPQIASALATIEEHHPDARVWVEYVAAV